MSKNLWVVGDSTLSSFEDKYYLPRYGYGTKLQEYLDDEIIVKNIALSGRSSKSYTTEPEYQTLLSGMKKDDYLIIGFDIMMKRLKMTDTHRVRVIILHREHLLFRFIIIISKRLRRQDAHRFSALR